MRVEKIFFGTLIRWERFENFIILYKLYVYTNKESKNKYYKDYYKII